MRLNNEMFESIQSKYCYEGTDVLINKKDIRDASQLKEVENGMTAYKLAQLNLGETSFGKKFDIDRYKDIHKYLFEELYPFAGELRDENIIKSSEPYKLGTTHFCPITFLKKSLQYTLEEMNSKVRNLKTREDIVSFLSKYYLDLNMLHPFREGNGRTLREYLREYVEVLNRVLKTDYIIDYNLDSETKEALFKASILDDLEATKSVFNKMIKEKELEKNKSL